MKKDLSRKTKYKIAKKSYDNLVKLKQVASISFLYIGQELKKIKEEKLYRYLGEGSPEYESFDEFIKSPEINLELRKAYYLIQIYTVFCEQLGYEPEQLGGLYWTSLRTLLPVVKKDNVEELVEKAKNLTRGHLALEVRQLRSGLDEIGACTHEIWRKIVYYQCTKCYERSKFKPKGRIIE